MEEEQPFRIRRTPEILGVVLLRGNLNIPEKLSN